MKDETLPTWTRAIPCTKEGYAVYKDPESPGGFCTDPIIAFAIITDLKGVGSFLSPIVGDSEMGASEESCENFSHYHWGPKEMIKMP